MPNKEVCQVMAHLFLYYWERHHIMQRSKVWTSVEFVLGLALLVVGLGAHFALHSYDPHLLLLAPFGIGLILSDTVSRLVEFAIARAACLRRGAG